MNERIVEELRFMRRALKRIINVLEKEDGLKKESPISLKHGCTCPVGYETQCCAQLCPRRNI